MAQVVACGQAELKAATVVFNIADEGLGKIRGDGLVVTFLADGHAFQGVHHIGDVDLLRAAHRTVVTRHAVPGGVAFQDRLPHVGPDQGEQLARRVIHVGG